MKSTSNIEPLRIALASDWQTAFARDEWFFVRLMDEVVSRLSPADAFAAIDEVVSLLIHESEGTLHYYCGALMLELARRSDTTEMPLGLRNHWEAVGQLVRDYPDVAEQLKLWYRRR